MHAPSPDDLLAWDRGHYWHGFTQMAEYEPLIFVRGEGCRLIDVQGRSLLDGVSSLWCNVHGHRHPRIDAAIRAQLDRVAHVTSLGAGCDATIRLAKRLTEVAPPGLNHVFFTGDGAAAAEAGLKLAFQYWRQRPDPRPAKTKFLALVEGYHGDTLGAVSVGGVERFHRLFGPLLFDVVRIPAPDLYRLPEGVAPEAAVGHYLGKLEEALAARHEELAALVIEPLVQGAAGMLVHPPGFLRGARELTRKYDVLLMADEVAVGFGRTGTLFACEQEGVVPDLLCLGKGITGGYLPMAATLATDDVYGAFLGTYAEARTFFHGHTYAGNPLAAAAALASLDVFAEERTLERLPPKVERLGAWLRRIAQLPGVGDVRQRGLMAGIELVRDRASREPYPWEERRGARACDEAIRRGVWLRPLGNVVVLMPPLAISLDELDELGAAAEAGVVAATAD